MYLGTIRLWPAGSEPRPILTRRMPARRPFYFGCHGLGYISASIDYTGAAGPWGARRGLPLGISSAQKEAI